MQLFLFTTLESRKLFLVTEHIVRSYLRLHSVCEFVAEHQYDMLRRQVLSINDVRGHSKTSLTISTPLKIQLSTFYKIVPLKNEKKGGAT